MKVILLQDIARLGKRGDVKDVAEGFAMNVLIPKKQVIQATPGELALWKQKEDIRNRKKEVEGSIFLKLIDVLHNNQINISDKKRDGKGQLFAQIKETDVVDAIFKVAHISVDQKQITIPKPIKSIGNHEIVLKQGNMKEKISLTVS